MPYEVVSGKTWGTYYRMTMQTDQSQLHHGAIQQVLKDFDAALSTYVPTSSISIFNESKKGHTLSQREDQYFAPVLARSRELAVTTDGYLNVAVMPLLNYWGFGYEAVRRSAADVDSAEVARLLPLLDLGAIRREQTGDSIYYQKTTAQIEVDFSALAKGYGIDIIAQYLDKAGVANYLIDIGGEARARGVNSSGQPWTLAINKPYKDADYTTQELILQLHGKSIATSGNYREMYEVDGLVLGHILNPNTGYPDVSDVLSASIIADDCMTADGLATACVAAGLERAKAIIAKHPNVAACLIYDGDGDAKLEKYYAGGFEKFVLKEVE